MIDVSRVLALHDQMVIRWHAQAVDNPYDEAPLSTICQQHGFNFLLWHEEDIARSPDATDQQIAQVKRSIDRYNQQRNDWMERVDDWLSEQLREHGVSVSLAAPLNTETCGSVIDRLSIISLRLYHLEEQLRRPEAPCDHWQTVRPKIAICRAQREDLAQALGQLLDDIASGRKRHRTYRQLKMYNDPTLNPYLYGSRRRLAS